MKKQAKKAPDMAQKDQFVTQELDLQMRFSRMSSNQKQIVGNYLNSYNLAAWIYNELLDEDSRQYIDLAMKYTMETLSLSHSMCNVSEDPNEVDQLVNKINHGK